MRRVLLFLVIFGAGAGLLWLGTRDRGEAPAPAPEEPGPDVEANTEAEVPVTEPAAGPDEGPSADDDRLFFRVRGVQSFDLYGESDGDSRPRIYHVEGSFEPTDSSFRTYAVTDLLVEQFDPLTGQLLNAVRAESATLGISGTRRDELRLADDGKLMMEKVTIQRAGGHELAPLTFRAPAVEAFLDRQSFRSVGDGEVEFEGSGLRGRGGALEYDGLTGFVALRNGGEVSLDQAGPEPVTISTPESGDLEIQRVGEVEEGRFLLQATEGARLVSSGERPATIDADAIRVSGRVVEAGEEGDPGSVRSRVRLEDAEALGGVMAIREGAQYSGENAEIEADGSGRLTRIVLANSPRARVVLESSERIVPVEAEGEGPLTVEFGSGRSSFRLDGPSRVEAEERSLVITAQEYLAGELEDERERLTISGMGDVRAEQGERRLQTETLEAVYLADLVGTTRMVSEGPTRMSGPDDMGRPTTIDVAREMDLFARGESWIIPVAREVRVDAVGGLQPFRATAGILRDLDWGARTLTAEEGVSWVGVFGEGDARSVTLRPDGSIYLVGESGVPARFRVLPGRLPAESRGAATEGIESASFAGLAIDVRGDETAARLEARGEVSAVLEGLDTDYEFDSGSADFELLPAEGTEPRRFELLATEVSRLWLRDSVEETSLSADRLEVSGILKPDGEGEERRLAPLSELIVATGGVVIDHEGEVTLRAEGGTFRKQGERVEIEPSEDVPVTVSGRIPGSELPFELTADSFTWSGRTLDAARPVIAITAPLLSKGGGVLTQPAALSARELHFDEKGLALTGDAELVGADASGIPLRVQAGKMLLSGDLRTEEDGPIWGDAIESFEATDSFVAIYGGLGIAHGRELLLTRERARIVGSEGQPAIIEASAMALETEKFEVDLESFLWTAGRGVIRDLEARGKGDLEFALIEPMEVEQGTFFSIVSPVWVAGTSTARCDFVAAWIDAALWQARGRAALYGEPAPLVPPTPPSRSVTPGGNLVPDVFGRLSRGELPRYLKALHLMGTLEVTEEGRTTARAEEVFLDLESREGWLDEAELAARAEFSSDEDTRFRVRSGRLNLHSDGTLRAKGATITTSRFDRPGYVIETDEFVLEPLAGSGEASYRLGMKGNRIRFSSGFNLPLPSLGNLALDEEGDVVGLVGEEDEKVKTVDYFQAGQYARYGTTLGGAIRSDIGKLGRKIARFFGFDPEETRGKWYTEASWLSDRGPLIGLGLEVREKGRHRAEKEDFWFNLYAKGIPDSGTDRGLVRVDKDDRKEFRSWIHGRSRYPFSDTEWIDVSYTTQSDPGVQAEFYQSEYQRYEERYNYIHWRRAEGDRYLDASVSGRVDDYRTTIEELPSAGIYRGEHEIAKWGRSPLLHGWSLDLDNLRRLQGDLRYEDAFLGFNGQPDGLGDRSVTRASLEQRLALPTDLGVGGLRATPWMEGIATVWDETLDPDTGATRLAAIGGVDLATTLVQRTGGKQLHTLTPLLTFRRDLAVEEDGGDLVRFDRIDDPVEGQEVGLGFRALWWGRRDGDSLDLSTNLIQQTQRSDDLPDREIASVLTEWRTHLGTVPIGLLHDGRFDLDDERTIYARSTLALQPVDPLIFEISYRRGLGADQRGLFETASFDARYRFDPKWEFQLGQDIAVKGNQTLRSNLIIRRFGADFLFELGIDYRAGEGGTSFGINFAPLFLYRRSPLGILER